MKVEFDTILRDYLALRGESPDLLPELEEGEDSAVLTLADALRVRLLPEAVKATLEIADERPEALDELRSLVVAAQGSASRRTITVPADYLRLYSLQMDDWAEPLTAPEPEGSLRRALGAAAPGWMINPERPMLVERHGPEGLQLVAYGTVASSGRLLYIPLPSFDGSALVISSAAYPRLLNFLREE